MPRDVPRRGRARIALARRDAIRRRRLGDERERQIRRGARLRRHYRQCRFPRRQPRQGHSGAAHHPVRRTFPRHPERRDLAPGSEPQDLHLRPGEGLYLDRAWREGFAALAPLNLSFEAWMFHSQLGDLVDLARVFPETKIVLNHIGGALGVGPYADKRKEVFEEWRTQISKLGQFPNVYIKL